MVHANYSGFIPIQGFPKYSIDELGNIHSQYCGRNLKHKYFPGKVSPLVTLYHHGFKKEYQVKDLIALHHGIKAAQRFMEVRLGTLTKQETEALDMVVSHSEKRSIAPSAVIDASRDNRLTVPLQSASWDSEQWEEPVYDSLPCRKKKLPPFKVA